MHIATEYNTFGWTTLMLFERLYILQQLFIHYSIAVHDLQTTTILWKRQDQNLDFPLIYQQVIWSFKLCRRKSHNSNVHFYIQIPYSLGMDDSQMHMGFLGDAC